MDALIIAGMIFLFSTLSSESVFIDPKARKDVKKYITDERRKQEILELMSEYKEDYTIRRSIENDMEAGNSWRVMLDSDGRTVWISLRDGVATELFEFDPMTTPFQRAKAELMGIIPDRGQM